MNMNTVGDLIAELQKHDQSSPLAVIAVADAGTADMRGTYLPITSVAVATRIDGVDVKAVTIAVEYRALPPPMPSGYGLQE